ncbi:MAG: DUF4190 domain-containing protein [Clostridiaceae bacterium]|jgi:hypothetical protein|nr:DUF4190 domain-containing protein [Clostridiaceae bacterium]
MENNTQYQQPGGYAPPPAPAQTNGMAIAALVCGVLGIIGSFIPYVMYFTAVLAVLGIIFGVMGMKKAKQIGSGNGLAVAGLVLGIVGTVFAIIGIICYASVACALKKGFDAIGTLS